MKSLYSKFRQKHGEPFDQRPVPQETIDHYAGKVPHELIELWRSDGWCGYGKGFVWTVNPSEYEAILADWLGEANVSTKYVVIRTAFGGMFYWDGEDFWYLDPVDASGPADVPDRLEHILDGTLCHQPFLDHVMHYQPFVLAVAKLGRLTHTECYGFVPPLAAGGPGTLESTRRVDLAIHLNILAQFRS